MEEPKSYIHLWETFDRGRGRDELRPICIDFAEHVRPHTLRALFVTRNELAAAKEEMAWMRIKLGLPADASTSEVQGKMHVLDAHAHGYVTYIEAFKCEDKQGEIARLTVEVAELRDKLPQT